MIGAVQATDFALRRNPVNAGHRDGQRAQGGPDLGSTRNQDRSGALVVERVADRVELVIGASRSTDFWAQVRSQVHLVPKPRNWCERHAIGRHSSGLEIGGCEVRGRNQELSGGGHNGNHIRTTARSLPFAKSGDQARRASTTLCQGVLQRLAGAVPFLPRFQLLAVLINLLARDVRNTRLGLRRHTDLVRGRQRVPVEQRVPLEVLSANGRCPDEAPTRNRRIDALTFDCGEHEVTDVRRPPKFKHAVDVKHRPSKLSRELGRAEIPLPDARVGAVGMAKDAGGIGVAMFVQHLQHRCRSVLTLNSGIGHWKAADSSTEPQTHRRKDRLTA